MFENGVRDRQIVDTQFGESRRGLRYTASAVDVEHARDLVEIASLFGEFGEIVTQQIAVENAALNGGTCKGNAGGFSDDAARPFAGRHSVGACYVPQALCGHLVDTERKSVRKLIWSARIVSPLFARRRNRTGYDASVVGVHGAAPLAMVCVYGKREITVHQQTRGVRE